MNSLFRYMDASLLLLATFVIPASAQTTFDARSSGSLGKVRIPHGKTTLHVIKLNPVRYKYQIAREVTITAGPDLSKIPGIPPLGEPSPAPTTKKGVTEPCKDLGTIDQITDCIDAQFRIKNQVLRDMQTLNDLAEKLNAFVESSDLLGQAEVLTRIGATADAGLRKEISDALQLDIIAKLREMRAQVDVVKAKLSALATSTIQEGGKDVSWISHADNKQKYDIQTDRVHQLETFLTAGDQQQSAILQTRSRLFSYQAAFEAIALVGAKGFSLDENVECGAFSKDIKLSLVRTARREGDSSSGTTEMVIFVCPAVISVSTGFGFSSVEQRDFFFAPTVISGRNTSVFALKDRSSARPLPLVLLNTRLYDFNNNLGLHFSTGVGVDLKTGQTGTEVEYVVGLSLLIRNQFVLTFGGNITRVPELIGGFQVGQEVPTGISEPPLQKNLRGGVAFTFTYKIK